MTDTPEMRQGILPQIDVHAVRRVVSGLDDAGRSTVVLDELSPHVRTVSDAIEFTQLWATPSSPPTQEPFADGAPGLPFGVIAPSGPHGSVIRVAVSQPDPPDVDIAALMHTTATVDYVLVLSGVLSCVYEDGTAVDLRPGDVLVQRGVSHAWSNRGAEPAVWASVLVTAPDHAPSDGPQS
jgi:mannose-6-phosphate isomerase-like protein (cupin superfamily)